MGTDLPTLLTNVQSQEYGILATLLGVSLYDILVGRDVRLISIIRLSVSISVLFFGMTTLVLDTV